MAQQPLKNIGLFQERDVINQMTKRRPEDIYNMQTQFAGSFRPGGSNALSDVLGSRLQSQYADQLADIKAKYLRNAPIALADLNAPTQNVVSGKYADILRQEAQERAAAEARRAKKKARMGAVASLAGMAAGGFLAPTAYALPAAMAGGGLGGLIGGGE